MTPYGCLCGGCVSCLRAQGFSDEQIFGVECAAPGCHRRIPVEDGEYCEEHWRLGEGEDPTDG